MTTEILIKKTDRYLAGNPMPAEQKQIQNWLSCTKAADMATADERTVIETEILCEIQAYTAYPLFYPKPEPWWRKFTAIF
jgi:hypothetical protein